MSTIVTAKHEEKKTKATTRAYAQSGDQQLEQTAGASAGMPLFLLGVQPKLSSNQSNNSGEQEANTTADLIMRSPASSTSSCCLGKDEAEMCEDCRKQHAAIARSAMPSAQAGSHTPTYSVLNQALRSPGHPLDTATRAFFEPRFGRDFSNVRIHTDSNAAESAAAIQANAYCLGNDIWFGSGKYAPETTDGKKLLAHEMTHTVQQQRNGNSSAASILSRKSAVLGRINDPLEAEADRVANTVMTAHDHSPVPISQDQTHSVRGAWYDFATDAGEWALGKLESGGKAVIHGAEWVGENAYAGAKLVGNWTLDKLKNAKQCFQSLGSAASKLVTGDFDSLADLLGIPAPAGADPSTLSTIIAALKHPCLQMIPGYGLISSSVGILERVGEFLVGAYRLMQNPQPLIDGIRNEIGKMINGIAGYVQGLVTKALKAVGAKAREFGEGVWRHLEPKLDYLAKHWWEVIKETGWQLLWPWPSVGKELGKVWDHLKAAGDHLWNLRFSKAVDEILAVERGVNSILGSLYGWFFIASVLVGAILGGIFGVGAGAIPGAIAGAAFAGDVGEALLLLTVAVESASLGKSVYNLMVQKETESEKEADYEQIASSSLTLAITGVMVVLGAIAVKFAQGILSKAARFLRRAGADADTAAASGIGKGVKGETPKVESPKADAHSAEPVSGKAKNATPQEAESIKAHDLPELEKEVHTPDKVHPPEDPAFAKKYDAEVKVGEHTYRRSNTDATWCRFSEPLCGINLGEVNAEVDDALASATKAKPKLSDEVIDLAIERLQERHNIDPAKIPELRQFLRDHPEALEDIGELMKDTPDMFEKPEIAPDAQSSRGGSKPGELGKLGKDLSRADAVKIFKETWITDEAEFTVKLPDGSERTFIADMGTMGPNGEPTLVEAKFGSGAGLTEPQEIGYPIVSQQGATPANASATKFAQKAFPGWKPGQPIPPTRVRIDYWAGTKRTSIWLPAGK